MPRIAGIQFEKDSKGNNRYIRIDLKKHRKGLEPFLKTIGIEKDDFDMDWERGVTTEACKTEMHNRMAKWYIGRTS
jgi:hypothetical protein